MIPDDICERLIALADAGERVWQETAVITKALLRQPAVIKMELYSEVGGLVGMKASAVRGWVSVYNAVGEDLLAELPQFRYSHWRMLVSAARQNDCAVSELALRWAATGDDYGGLPIPPDALAAKLNSPKEERDPFDQALERAGRALASAGKHAPDTGTRAALRLLAMEVERIFEAQAA